MSRFTELPSPVELEAEVLRFWKDAGIFEKSLEQRKDAPRFVFYEGPPTANGMPHNGHVLTRVVKDLFPRYRTMRGYRVDRKAGWDTHGLPVEVEVEKELGIHGKAAIEAYGVEPFARKCIQNVFTYTREWEDMTARVGFWVNLEAAYVTYHRSYVESVWWALSELFAKGLLYQDYKVVWWWPQGGTALSAGEVGEGYKTVDDPSVTVRFAVENRPATYLLAWTTTPWTLPSNVALAVNPELDYAIVKLGEETVILAEGRRVSVLGEDVGEILEVVKGTALVGLTYRPLYTFAAPEGGRAYVVVPADHVTLGAGTGIVHTAPAFGEDDFQVRKAQGLGFLQLIASDGRFVPGTGFLEGRFCKEADADIVRELKGRGLVFRHETIRHEYPFCPRASSDPLIQYARPAWFIRTTAFKDAALANNAAVNWFPETIREGRFGDFLRNNVDWALSRERFWGTPLNIWVCEACGKKHAPTGAAEIIARGGVFDPSVSPDLQIHKPWVDRVTFPCDACPGTMTRVTEVIDCWFDSGCMPFAQWGFPHQGQDAFKSAFPADFISEAVDQTRGWFYSLLMISTLLFDEETCARLGMAPVGFPRPYRNCIVLGHVCDARGEKESKSKGNYTSPDLVFEGRMKVKVVADASLAPGTMGMKPAQVKSLGCGPDERMTAPDGSRFEVVDAKVTAKDTVAFHPDDAARLGPTTVLTAPFSPPGADAFRWLFYASGPPWVNTRISLKAILDGQREFLIRLRNVHQFYVLNAGDHVPATPSAADPLDAWVLHEVNDLIARCTVWLDGYAVYEPARAIGEFVDALSNWWLRRSRDRFGGSDAKDTLYYVLTRLAAVIAPFVPFMADGIYRSLRLGGPESVHLCDWPAVDAAYTRPSLGEDMALVRDIASLGLTARNNVGVRVRQPLSTAEVVLADPGMAARIAPLLDLVRDELNVRVIRPSTQADQFVTFKVKPDFKVLGARLGKDMKACAAALAGMEGAEVRRQVLGGGLVLDLPGGRVTLGPAEIVVGVEPKPGFQAAGSARAVVALHTALDEDLLEEGLAREIVAKVQAVRKQQGLAYGQLVGVQVDGGPRTVRVLGRYAELITRSTSTELRPVAGDPVDVEVDGESLTIRVG